MSLKAIIILGSIFVCSIFLKLLSSDEKKMARAIIIAIAATIDGILITPVGNQFSDALTDWLTKPEPYELVPGDVNGDSKITQQDADIVLEIATSLLVQKPVYMSDAMAKAADFDRDGEITTHDSRLILVYCVKHGSAE